MNAATLSSNPLRIRREFSILLALITVVTALLTASCGSNSMMGVQPSGNTQVALVLTGTANDQLQEFDLEIQSLTLTNKAGKTVTLISSLQPAEFIHINGGIEPLLTVSIPQDIYTSATAVIGSAQFVCVEQTPGTLATSTFAYGQTPQANVAVNLPAPITVEGETMALSLNFLVSQSATYSACFDPNGVTYAITPTFNLAPFALSSEPNNAGNGLVTALNGQVSSIDSMSSSFVLALPELENPRTISISSTGATTYQGISNFSGLAAGTFVNLDGAIQPDSSLVATRIAAVDTAATTLTAGPLMNVAESEPASFYLPRQQQGALFAGIYAEGSGVFSFGTAQFLISSELSNLLALPFTPSFSGANMVPGQNLYLSTASLLNGGGPLYTPMSTVMLIPQTINGTVSAVSNSGNFTVYTVTLADYDLFPNLAVQPGQANLLTNPIQVEVYMDSSTQLLNSTPLAPGSVARFYGLVFNDNGTLRMDCAQVNDGVELNPSMTPSAAARMVKGQVTVVRTANIGAVRHIFRRITPWP